MKTTSPTPAPTHPLPESALTCVLVWPPQQKQLKRRLARATLVSRRHAKQAQTRLDRLSFVQPDLLRSLPSLAADMDVLQSGVSTLPPIDPSNADMPGLEPGK